LTWVGLLVAEHGPQDVDEPDGRVPRRGVRPTGRSALRPACVPVVSTGAGGRLDRDHQIGQAKEARCRTPGQPGRPPGADPRRL